jgi:hypothetical protein
VVGGPLEANKERPGITWVMPGLLAYCNGQFSSPTRPARTALPAMTTIESGEGADHALGSEKAIGLTETPPARKWRHW